MAGRPSKYNDEIGPEIYEFMKSGKSVSAAAELIGVHRDTFYDWEKSKPEFKEWFKRARQASCTYWETQLENLALNETAKSSPQYKSIELILASRHRDLYSKSAKQEIDINYTNTMSDEEIDKQLEMLISSNQPSGSDSDEIH